LDLIIEFGKRRFVGALETYQNMEKGTRAVFGRGLCSCAVAKDRSSNGELLLDRFVDTAIYFWVLYLALDGDTWIRVKGMHSADHFDYHETLYCSCRLVADHPGEVFFGYQRSMYMALLQAIFFHKMPLMSFQRLLGSYNDANLVWHS